MPDANPFDSYARRLSGASEKASRDREAAQEAAQEAGDDPFDSYTGRLQDALASKTSETPTAETPLTREPSPGPANLDVRDTGPVGQGDYVVRHGDCMESIAVKHGFFWESLWNDSNNSELRETRKNPNVLLADDRVTIREKERKEEPGETEQVHRFRRRGMPSKLKLRYLKRGEPRAGESYAITIDGKHRSGELDADGVLEISIPPSARLAQVRIGNDARVQRLVLGSTDPLSEISGVQARLNNLGFNAGPIDNQLGPKTRAALRGFQERYELERTGEPDDPTRKKLVEMSGS